MRGANARRNAIVFERHRSGVHLTAAGSRLLPRARHIVEQLDAALADVRSRPIGRVRIGTFPIAAASVIPEALVQLRAEHPDLVVTLRESTTPALVRSIRAGTIDLAVVAQSPPYRLLDSETPTLHVSTLVERDLVVAAGPGHPLARRRAVEVEDLLGQVWVASPRDGCRGGSAPCRFAVSLMRRAGCRSSASPGPSRPPSPP
jgi:DNA-binding transcriptional LysR family regulator